MMPRLTATDTIQIELTATTWNQIMQVMAEAPLPHRVVDPLIRAIQQQCLEAVNAGETSDD